MSRQRDRLQAPAVFLIAPAALLACAAARPAPPKPSPASRQPACTDAAEIPLDSNHEVTMLSLCIASASSSQNGTQKTYSVNDDRVRVAHGGRALIVADGSGPRYGGYHRPIAIDTGLDVLESALRPSVKVPCTEACVRSAFDAANAAMFSFETAFKPVFEEELAKTHDDRLAASQRAWQRVARARLGRDIEDDAHASASVTALIIDGASATIGQVGTARAYRCRAGTVELLLPDQSLNTDPKLQVYGDGSYYGAASALLGLGPTAAVLTRTVGVRPDDRFVLCTDGVWSALTDADIAHACALTSPEDIRVDLARAARDGGARDDVTIAVAVVSAS